MDAAQFAQFIQIERNDRDKARRATREQHEGRIRTAEETSERQKAEDLAKRITKCNGATTRAVREWIREVELTIPYTDRTVYVALQSVEGELRRELERYLNDEAEDREAVTWNDLRKH